MAGIAMLVEAEKHDDTYANAPAQQPSYHAENGSHARTSMEQALADLCLEDIWQDELSK